MHSSQQLGQPEWNSRDPAFNQDTVCQCIGMKVTGAVKSQLLLEETVISECVEGVFQIVHSSKFEEENGLSRAKFKGP